MLPLHDCSFLGCNFWFVSCVFLKTSDIQITNVRMQEIFIKELEEHHLGSLGWCLNKRKEILSFNETKGNFSACLHSLYNLNIAVGSDVCNMLQVYFPSSGSGTLCEFLACSWWVCTAFPDVLGLQQAGFQGQDFCFVSFPGLRSHGHTTLKGTQKEKGFMWLDASLGSKTIEEEMTATFL